MTAYRRDRMPGLVDPAAVATGLPIPTGTVAAWLAEDLGLADGAAVTSWPDRVSGLKLETLPPAGSPTFVASGIGGQSSVSFTGSQVLHRSGAISTSESGCVVVVAEPLNPAAGAIVWAGGSSSSSDRYNMGGLPHATGANDFMSHYNRNGGSPNLLLGSSAVVGVPQIYEWSSDGSTVSMRVGNSVESITVNSGSNVGGWFADVTMNNFTVGAWRHTATSYWFKGTVALVLVVDTPLSSTNRGALYDWLGDIYGL